jgi:transketolase
VGGVPGLVMVAPSCPGEVGPLLDWCLETHSGPSFLRMVSLPADIDWRVPEGYRPTPGRGFAITQGGDAVLIGSGPTLLAQAVKAARVLAEEKIWLSVVNLPWLNRVDDAWIAALAKGKRLLVTLDDHYVEGGQGEKVLAALARSGVSTPTLQLGLTAVPPSGQPGEVLERLGLDGAGIAARVRAALLKT